MAEPVRTATTRNGVDGIATYENNKPCREAQGVVAEMRLEHKR